MSRKEAMKLIEGREYADPGFRRGWAKRTSRTIKAACDAALLRRGQRPNAGDRSAIDWVWKGVGIDSGKVI